MRTFSQVVLILFLIACSQQDKKIDHERFEILTDASEIANFYEFNLDVSGLSERARTRKYLDGSYELKYEYDLMETTDYLPLFYPIKIERDISRKEAEETFNIGKNVILKTNSISGRTVEEITEIEIQGEQCYYAYRKRGEEITGTLFFLRRGMVNYTLIMTGLYSSNHSLITDLILPKLKDLENFRIVTYED